MLRSVAFAFGLLFSLAFLGCGGSAPGTGAGGDIGPGGGNTIGVVELLVDAVCYQTRMDVDETCSKPLRRASGVDNPIFEWKFEARDCNTNAPLYQDETSDFGVFWHGLKVQFPKQGCVNVINTITLPLPNKPDAVWNGAKRIENTADLDPRNPPAFILYTSDDW